MHSPPTIVRHIVRPKSAEPPRSPLLKRVQSEEKLAPSYGTDKKHLCSRKHSLEVTQEEVNREISQREVTLQSLEENALDAPSLTRVRPAEQGCLKRPISRKVGRQESIDELDREKLKVKIVVKKQDLAEKQEYVQKTSIVHEPCGESEHHKTTGLEERDGKKTLQKALERSNLLETKIVALETPSGGGMLKDTLQKKANMRSNDDCTASDVHSPCHGPSSFNELSHLSYDFRRISPPCTLQDVLPHSSDKMLTGKGDNADKTVPTKEFVKFERLDHKLANIDYFRKKMSFDDKDDSPCPVTKSKLTPNVHECHQLNAVRSINVQQDSSSVAESRSFISSAHAAQISSVPFIPLKTLNVRAETGVEKSALISTESPVRKSPSEYKLEGRSVSCLKPIEGTLDIALLSGPQISKTDVSLSSFPGGQSANIDSGCPVPLTCQDGRSMSVEALHQKERLPAFHQSKSCSPDLLEFQCSKPNKATQNSPATAAVIKQQSEKNASALSAKIDLSVRATNLKKEIIQCAANEIKSSTIQNQSSVSAAGKPSIAPGIPEKTKRKEKKAPKEGPDNHLRTQRSHDILLVKPETSEDSSTKRLVADVLPNQDPKHIQRCSFESGALMQICGTAKLQVTSSKAKPKDAVKPSAKEDDISAKECSGNKLGMRKVSACFKPEVSLPQKSLQAVEANCVQTEKVLLGITVQKDTPRDLGTKEQKQPPNTQPITGDKVAGTVFMQQGISDLPTVKELANKPLVMATPIGYYNQDNLRPALHLENSTVKSRQVLDTSSVKSKHSDKSPLTSKQVATNIKEKETGAQVLTASRKEGKNVNKTALDSFSYPSCSQRKLNNEHVKVERQLVIEGGSEPTIQINSTMLASSKSQAVAVASDNTNNFQRQELASLSEPVEQKPLHLRNKQTLLAKAAAAKDSSLLSKQVDKGHSSQITPTEKLLEGKKCTDALYVQNDPGKSDPNISLAGCDARGKEKAVMGNKNSQDTKGKGHTNPKQPADGCRQHVAKNYASAALQNLCCTAVVTAQQLDCPPNVPEHGLPSAKATLGSQEPLTISCREVKKQTSSTPAEMTKSVSLLGSASVEEGIPASDVEGKSKSQEKSHSVSNAAADIKGRDPTRLHSSARKQSAGKELPKSGTSADSLNALSSDKDSARQRRAKDNTRSSPHKKSS